MENLQIALIASLTPQVFMALIGALFGGLIGVRDRFKEYGIYLTVLLVVSSVMIGAAVADYCTSEHQLKSLFLSWVIGLGFGIFGSMTVDMLRLASPSMAEKLVHGVGNETITAIIDFIRRKPIIIRETHTIETKVEEPPTLELEIEKPKKSRTPRKKPLDTEEIE